MTTQAVGDRRLLKLADILDKADALHKKRGEPAFCMDKEIHDCGTPACAWGHYVLSSKALTERFGVDFISYYDAKNEFALDRGALRELFWFNGCGDAQTAKQAANYIRRFVAKRRAK